jgi:Na+-driven multidrug efflux pump
MYYYSFGSYTSSLLAQTPGLIFPLIVINNLGTETSAYFYISWTTASLINAVSLAISKSLFAEGINDRGHFRENIIRSIKFNLMISIPIVIALIITGKWILLAFGVDYSESASTLLSLLLLANLPRGINLIYVGFLRVRDHIKEMITVHAISTILALSIGAWMSGKYGIVSIGWIWLIIQMLVCLVFIYRLKHWFKQKTLSETQ